nr:LamG-like jellyroll fold domain-containing protein [uncultured Carboxylicivirga sp.]
MKAFYLVFSLWVFCSSINGQTTVGLVGHFPFTNGSLSDLMGIRDCSLSSHGTDTYFLVEDRFGNSDCAIDFQGAIFAAGSANRNITSEVSISVWIKTTDKPEANRFVVTKYGYNFTDVPICGYTLFFNDTVRFDSRDENWRHNDYMVSNYSKRVVNDGEWHHIVGITHASPALLEIWIDDTKENYQEYGWDLVELDNPLQNLCIAGSEQYNSTPTFKGVIDDIRIYNRALSESEVHDLFMEENPNTNIETNLATAYTITPNPTKGNIRIISTNQSSIPTEISLYNLAGTKVYFRNFNFNNSIDLDISSFTKGIYLLVIENEDLKTINKLILQ